MRVVSPTTVRQLRTLGAHVAAGRKIHQLTAADLAERAGITVATLRSIEQGTGGPRIEAVLSVLRVLGVSAEVVAAADPLTTEYGRLHYARTRVKRVRL